MKKVLSLSALSFILAACSTTLPPNAEVVSSKSFSNKLVSITHEYPSKNNFPVELKCVTQIVKNDGASLKDSSRAFVGQATGTFYDYGNNFMVSGGNAVQYADERTKTIIAKGIDYGNSSFMVNNYISYTLTLEDKDGTTKLTFNDIKQAQESTGFAVNRGFSPITTNHGPTANLAYEIINNTAKRIELCM